MRLQPTIKRVKAAPDEPEETSGFKIVFRKPTAFKLAVVRSNKPFRLHKAANLNPEEHIFESIAQHVRALRDDLDEPFVQPEELSDTMHYAFACRHRDGYQHIRVAPGYRIKTKSFVRDFRPCTYSFTGTRIQRDIVKRWGARQTTWLELDLGQRGILSVQPTDAHVR